MNTLKLAFASVLCLVTSPAFADPEMSVFLDRFQGDNWVWRGGYYSGLRIGATG
jgi:hypothetical protein